jgi:hypothetical protein
MLECKVVLLVLEESMLMLFKLLMEHVIIVTLLAQPALEDFILNALFVTLQLLLWLVEMNAEEFALELTIGEHQIILVSPVWLLVLIVSELELMNAIVALMDFI